MSEPMMPTQSAMLYPVTRESGIVVFGVDDDWVNLSKMSRVKTAVCRYGLVEAGRGEEINHKSLRRCEK
jgi:hypothetical protein